MQERLCAVVGEVRSSAGGIHHASAEVARGNADLSTRTEQAVNNLQQTASSMEQLTVTAALVEQSAASAASLSDQATKLAGAVGVFKLSPGAAPALGTQRRLSSGAIRTARNHGHRPWPASRPAASTRRCRQSATRLAKVIVGMDTAPSQVTPAAGKAVVDPLARAFFIVALALSAAALAFALWTVAIGGFAHARVLVAMPLAALAALGGAAWLARRGHLRAGVAVAIAAGYLFTTSALAPISDPGQAISGFRLYGLLTLTAGVLLGRSAAAFVGALCAATLLGAHAVAAGWMAEPGAALRSAAWAGLGEPLLVMAASVLLACLLGPAMQASFVGARNSERRFRRLLSIGADWYWESDSEHRLTHIATTVDGRTPVALEPMLGKTQWEIDGSSLSPAQWSAHRADLDARRPFANLVMARLDPQGERRFVSVSGEPQFDRHGAFAGFWGISRDVTERELEQSALHRSEQMLARLFEASPDAIMVSDRRTSQLVMVNDSFASMFGYARDELIGRTSLELGLWADAAERAEIVQALERDGVVHGRRVRRRTRDGRLLTVRYSASRLSVDGQDYMLGTLRDVTEQEREQLQHEAILANAPVGIAFTRDRRFLLANPRFEQLVGWDSGTLAGQPGSAVWPSAESYAQVGQRVGPRLAAGELVVEDMQFCRRDGSLFWSRVHARAIDVSNPVEGGTLWIAQDVSTERAQASELAAAKDAAEAANRAKSAFLANTSHEMRTPLNGLLGLTRLALRPGLEDQALRRYLQQIGDSGQMLHTIISDILDLSKIEAGRFTIEHIAFDLHALLASVAASYRELAMQQGLAFTLRVDATVPARVMGDPTRLRQLLANYLSNALKFTSRGSVILQATAHDGAVRMTVTDTGPGIDAAMQARLFTPFMQGDASTTRRFGGTGLGLAICRQIAELMDGRVGVHSELGSGSRFWVELPLLQADDIQPAPESVFDTLATDALCGLSVLLVEDNDVNRMIAQALLSIWGADVVTAADGREAVAIAHASDAHFDIVLMDLHMPVMNGLEATALLRAHQRTAALPVVALTAAALEEERSLCLAAGMNDFVAKPFDERQLLRTLLRWTRRARSVDLTG